MNRFGDVRAEMLRLMLGLRIPNFNCFPLSLEASMTYFHTEHRSPSW